MTWNTWQGRLALAVVLVILASLVFAPLVAGAGKPAATPGKVSSVRVYLIAIGDNGKSGKKIGCGDSLVAVVRKVTPTRAPLTAALRLTTGNHAQFYGQSGLYNALYQSRLTLQRVTVVKGTATVQLSGKLRLGGVCDAPRVRAQLRQAALQFPSVQRVFVSFNGVPLSRALTSK